MWYVLSYRIVADNSRGRLRTEAAKGLSWAEAELVLVSEVGDAALVAVSLDNFNEPELEPVLVSERTLD